MRHLPRMPLLSPIWLTRFDGRGIGASSSSCSAARRVTTKRPGVGVTIRHLREAFHNAISLQDAIRVMEALHTHNNHEADALLKATLDSSDAT